MNSTGKFILAGVVVVVLAIASLVCLRIGTIETGNVGVYTRFGNVNPEEIQPGIYVKFFGSVQEFSGRENAIEMNDLTAKAKDNLSLKDYDITVYYKINPSGVSEFAVRHSGQSMFDEKLGVWMPAYNLIYTFARKAAYDAAAAHDSLVLHLNRNQIEQQIVEETQKNLDNEDKGLFVITRAAVRSLITDPAVEGAIRENVQRQKELEAMTSRVQIAEKEAQIRVTEARGISEANAIIASSLTREYLQHETNEVLKKFAEKGSNTVVIPANMNTAPLINIPAASPHPVDPAASEKK